MLRIYLTGDICLLGEAGIVRAERLPGRQGRLVLAHLVGERAHGVSRDELVDSLWPDQPPAASEVALSAIISKLRAALAEVGLPRDALNAGSGRYELTLPAESWVDIEEAQESVHLAEAALLMANPQAAYGPAVVACAILRRPFMPGEDGAWAAGRREALRRNRLRALDCLAQIHAVTREHGLAVRAAEEAIELEPFREAGYRRLMLIHEAAGNRAEVVRIYSRLVALLAAELETAPGPETQRLVRRLSGQSDEADDDADQRSGSRDRAAGGQRGAAPRADVDRRSERHRD